MWTKLRALIGQQRRRCSRGPRPRPSRAGGRAARGRRARSAAPPARSRCGRPPRRRTRPVMAFQSRLGMPPWIFSAGFSMRRDVLGGVLGPPHLGAGDRRSNARLILANDQVDHRLVAVEREAHDPAADLQLARHPVEHVVGDRALAGPEVRALWPRRPRAAPCSSPAGPCGSSRRASARAACRTSAPGRRRARPAATAACRSPGMGISQTPIFVTIPKLDCMKSWSGVGPRPRL